MNNIFRNVRALTPAMYRIEKAPVVRRGGKDTIQIEWLASEESPAELRDALDLLMEMGWNVKRIDIPAEKGDAFGAFLGSPAMTGYVISG
jgi:hypothetical protein